MGIFVNPPDVNFYLNVVVTFLGIFALQYTMRVYRKIRSNDYLLMSISLFGIVASYPWLIYLLYFTPAWFSYLWIQDDRWFDYQGWITLFITLFYLSYFCLYLYVIRLRSWKSYKPLTKFFLSLLTVEVFLGSVAHTFIYNVTLWITRDWSIHSGEVVPWFFNISLIRLFSPTSEIADLLHDKELRFVTAIVVIIYFSTIKPSSNARPVIFSRLIWIFFGVTNLIINLVSSYFILFGETDANLFLLSIGIYGEVVMIIVLVIMIVTFPEALLISDYQILKARRLYPIVKEESERPSLDLFNFDKRLKEYVSTLPEELFVHTGD